MIANRTLRWALWATLAATAFVALQPDDAPPVAQRVAASRRGKDESGRGSARDTGQRALPGANSALPGHVGGKERADWPTEPQMGRGVDWPALLPTALAAWQPPPPPPPPPAPSAPSPAAAAPAPAPAFPYTLIGRVEEGGQVQVLLSGPLRTISARPNELIDGQWRLESLQPGGVVFVWVPGGQRLTVNYRSS